MTKMPYMPLVSVIMPAYNASKYIDEAIQSVIGQTYSNWELIVVDDCSMDQTRDIVVNYQKYDPRIILLTCPKNEGVAAARNLGLSSANGAWIALLDSDDIWLEDKLEKQLALVYRTDADLVYCSYSLMSSDREMPYLVPEETDFQKTLVKSVISCSTVLFSHAIAQKYRFDSNFYHEDYVYWLSVLKDGYRAVGCTEVLAKYRLLPNSRASNKWNSARHRWIIYRDFLHLPFFKRCSVFASYALAGLIKYK